MRDFFRSWKHKFGVVTLLLACALMTLWVRSLTHHEGVHYRTGPTSDQRVISFQSAIHWCWLNGSTNLDLLPSIEWFSGPHSLDLMVVNPGRVWRWSFSGFGIHDATYSGNARFTVLVIPYWSIVIPLTLLSAYLILSKPRPRAPKATALAPTNGA